MGPPSAGEDAEKLDPPYVADGNVTSIAILEESVVSLKAKHIMLLRNKDLTFTGKPMHLGS